MASSPLQLGSAMRSDVPAVRKAARDLISAALLRHNGRALPAAAELGVSYRSMARWVAEFPELLAGDKNCQPPTPPKPARVVAKPVESVRIAQKEAIRQGADNLRHQQKPQVTIVVTTRRYEPGELIQAFGCDSTHHYVYELIDDNGVPFYVGKTSRPLVRLETHLATPSTRPLGAKLMTVAVPLMRIVSVHLDEMAAEIAEREHILATPNLVNVRRVGPRKARM